MKVHYNFQIFFMYDVIVVGGGAAGLMAAKILSAAGKKILLLEAREQLGGRIHEVKISPFRLKVVLNLYTVI